jgi:hypothetical protein
VIGARLHQNCPDTLRRSAKNVTGFLITKDTDSVDSTRPLHYSKSDRRVTRVPTLSPSSSLTHVHRSIGYSNLNPQSLTESASRLMYLRVYNSRDNSHQSVPFPSLYYSFTHAHWSIGYHNHNPQLLSESTTRLMHLRVYDNRDDSHQSAPSPSLCYSLTHAHNTLSTPTLLTITCTQVLWFLECLTRPTVSSCETTRTRFTVCLPVQPSVCESF